MCIRWWRTTQNSLSSNDNDVNLLFFIHISNIHMWFTSKLYSIFDVNFGWMLSHANARAWAIDTHTHTATTSVSHIFAEFLCLRFCCAGNETKCALHLQYYFTSRITHVIREYYHSNAWQMLCDYRNKFTINEHVRVLVRANRRLKVFILFRLEKSRTIHADLEFFATNSPQPRSHANTLTPRRTKLNTKLILNTWL